MTINPSSSPTGQPDRSLHLQTACTLLVTAGAAYVSYWHGPEFALRFRADTTTATLWPLIVDGLLMTASIELWTTGHQHPATGNARHGRLSRSWKPASRPTTTRCRRFEPWAGHNADGPGVDQQFPAGRLVIESCFVISERGGEPYLRDRGVTVEHTQEQSQAGDV